MASRELDPNVLRLIEAADEAGFKLEIMAGSHTWETFAGPRHQQKIYDIRRSIGNTAVHYSNIYILFKDGSLKRPDIAVFRSEPKEQEGMVNELPEAVLEVVNPRFAKKDFEVGTQLYLAQGVKDVVVVDPRSGFY